VYLTELQCKNIRFWIG